MSALEFLLNAFSITLGVVFGTVAAWIMSYFLATRMLPSLRAREVPLAGF
jgi:hypothetical protein